MRACSPTLAHLVLPRLSRTSSSAGTERARSISGRRGPAFVAAMTSASSPPPPPPPQPQPLPFDGSARRGGLLHPRFSDPSPTPPEGEAAPPVRAAQQRCSRCGGELSVSWVEGRWRHACGQVGGGGSGSVVGGEAGDGAGCGTIAYTNPLLVVGAIVTDVDDALSPGEGGEKDNDGKGTRKKPRVLLVKRAIEPRKGSWTLPAGYLELGESAAEGAARETWEEARARVEIFGPYFHADVPAIGQTYLLFRGKLVRSSRDSSSSNEGAAPLPDFAPGPESLEVAFFDLDEIKNLDLAFSAITTALRLFTEDVERHGHFHYHHGTILKHPGGAPNAGTLVDHFSLPIRN